MFTVLGSWMLHFVFSLYIVFLKPRIDRICNNLWPGEQDAQDTLD